MLDDEVEKAIENMIAWKEEHGEYRQANRDYVEEHYSELQEEYAGENILIHDGHVLASGKPEDFDGELFEEIEDVWGETVRERAYVTHIRDPDMLYIPG